MGSHRVGHNWSDLACMHACMHALEKEMATHSSVLAWRIPGTGEPGGLPSVRSHRVRHDWRDLAAAAANVSHLVGAADFSCPECSPTEPSISVYCTPPSSAWSNIIFILPDPSPPEVHPHLFPRFLRVCEVAQSCPTLCDAMGCSLPGSSIHGIPQSRILEWIAISSSRGSSRPTDRTRVSCIAGRRSTLWATKEAWACIG